MNHLRDHPFFEALLTLEKLEKKSKKWTVGGAKKREFFSALREAHPFVYSRAVTHEKRGLGRNGIDFFNLVEEFSLPRSTSLYLLTDSPQVISPTAENDSTRLISQTLGYLIHEEKNVPERFQCFAVVMLIDPKDSSARVPVVHQFSIDLKRLGGCDWHKVDDHTVEMHWLKEICTVMQFTKAISVKRIGRQILKSFSVKSRGIGIGYTSVKEDNLYHVADKEDYDYIRTDPDANINWEYIGHWRGHWRALYYPENITDSFSRRVVDYTRVGKNRSGEYKVDGYTWVTEHTRGDADLADIKTHFIKAAK